MWLVNETNRETVHTCIAVALIAAGITAYFVDRVSGDVGTGTLTFIGEAFTLAGALLGIVQYVNGRISKLENRVKNGNTDD